MLLSSFFNLMCFKNRMNLARGKFSMGSPRDCKSVQEEQREEEIFEWHISEESGNMVSDPLCRKFLDENILYTRRIFFLHSQKYV